MSVVPERPAPAPDLYAEADVRRAARALLQTPLLHSEQHHDDLALVRRHRDELTKLFADGLGYRLVVEPALARLYKTGIGRDGRRGLRRRNGNHFTPRAYAMVALVLAALTRSRQQIMIDELVAGVRSAAVDAGVDVDLDALSERRVLHAALIALIHIGVMSERDGDLEHWAERRTDSLLDVHRDRLAVLVAAPLSRCATPEEVFEDASLPSSAGRLPRPDPQTPRRAPHPVRRRPHRRTTGLVAPEQAPRGRVVQQYSRSRPGAARRRCNRHRPERRADRPRISWHWIRSPLRTPAPRRVGRRGALRQPD